MKTVVLDLMCELDEIELLDRAQQMSSSLVRLREVQAERANTAKAYKEQLDGIAGTLDKLSAAVRRRAEMRPVTCQVMFHSPAVGIKRTVRTDTGEFVKDEPMSSTECQNNLFEVAPEPEKVDLEDLAERIKDAGAVDAVLEVIETGTAVDEESPAVEKQKLATPSKRKK